jgi:hypothetical protein
MDSDVEYVLLQKKECYVYQIPPARGTAGHYSEDWTNHIFTGKLRIVSQRNQCVVQVLDAQNQLYVACPVDPLNLGNAVERTTDSSRFFALKVKGPSGQHAYVGLGFVERNDAFDFWAGLLDFQGTVKADVAPTQTQPMDLRFREGQTISLGKAGAAPQAAKAGKPIPRLAPPPK